MKPRIRDANPRLLAMHLAILVGALMALGGCSDEEPTGPGQPTAALLALHSVGQTMQGYEVGTTIAPSGGSIDLGGLFDGTAMDLTGGVADLTAVTTESNFGGDRALIVDVPTRSTVQVSFTDDLVNPSKPYAVGSRGSAFVGGRASNSVYELSLTAQGSPPAVFARDVGEFVEKVVVTGGRVFAVDSNIDDVGFTFRPLGNSRVVVYELDGAPVREVELQGGLQAIDAVLSGGSLVVLNQGTLGPSFQPDGNGSLFVLDPASLQVAGPFELEGNGVSIEAGADGRVYVTVTNDFASIQSLRFDPAVPGFVDGPDSPIQVRDASGGPISCWTVTALGDGRLICATFRSEEAGDLYLLSSDGAFIDSTPGGFGTTDLEIVVP